jgi:hypothetical protein
MRHDRLHREFHLGSSYRLAELKVQFKEASGGRVVLSFTH